MWAFTTPQGVCVRVCLPVFAGYKSMRRAVAFTLRPALSCGGGMLQVKCQSAGHADMRTFKHDLQDGISHAALRNHAAKPSFFSLSCPCVLLTISLLQPLLLLLLLHSVALCCSALLDSHTAGVSVGVSPCDDLMWAAREHPLAFTVYCAVCSYRSLLLLLLLL